MKRTSAFLLLFSLLIMLCACEFNNADKTLEFTNKYGSKDTECAVTGCTDPIASSGYSNCCAAHSIMCLRCHCYVGWSVEYCSSCSPGTSYESINISANTPSTEEHKEAKPSYTPSVSGTQTDKNPTSTSTSFINKYGTATTVCAVSGCSNYIATSGDTNSCTSHSNKCAECKCYIDYDAALCMTCISDVFNSITDNSNNIPSTSDCSHASCAENGPFWCIGKNDTCTNQTSCAYILYCSECSESNNSSSGNTSNKNNIGSASSINNSGNTSPCGHSSCAENGPFWCMGKNDTCTNTTDCAYDYYCDECD